jgi:hypothetical protein
LKETQILLEENFSQLNRETEALNMTIKVEAEKNMKLSEALKTLKNKCFNFATQCAARLKSIFNSVGAASEEANLSTEDIPGALECVKKEVGVLDKVIIGHDDFYALIASRGTVAAFIKAVCNHPRAINRTNFGLSPANLIDIPVEAEALVTDLLPRSGQRAAENWLEMKLEICLVRYKKPFYLCTFILYFILPHSSLPAFAILQDDDTKS